MTAKTKARERELLENRELGERVLRRILRYVIKTNTCWLWTARAKTHGGYGKINVSKTVLRAHRVVWLMAHGAIPPEMYVCHTCDNPLCVNPVHLFLGTPKDNMTDKERKGRGTKPPRHVGEKHPHAKLTDAAVWDIRRSADSAAVLAERHGVTTKTVRTVLCGDRGTTAETMAAE